jgi:hypothetical protein
MALKSQVSAITRIEFDSSGLTPSYQTMDENGIDDDVVVFKMYNASNVDVDISFNGSTDQDIIPQNGTFVIDCGTISDGRRPAFPKGMQVWVKSASAGVGNIYVSGYTQVKG